ncbi:YidB family protein [Geothrix sp. PMB-07]|uniref:YidB family protein n=1 Tax=Geothrix sp. PMB-07 TaxID=3068640 RepID=UPI0027416B0C|nr:YidB family protein [Geothrix sp. PMB-07]WLT31266.1 YidB family protein [Geothrix sp. PMB-07]
MGLFDLAGQLLGQGQGDDSKSQLLQAALGLIQNHPGGLQGLLGKFQESGLGDHVASWVGTGENLPIQGEHVEQALGGEQLAALAQQAGVPAEQASGSLAALLPDLINHLTPHGQVPQEAALPEGLGGLLGKLMS